MRLVLLAFTLAWALAGAIPATADSEASVCSAASVLIDTAGYGDDAEARVAEILKERLQRRSDVAVSIGDEPNELGLRIYLGRLGGSEAYDQDCRVAGMELPGDDKPYAEGFAIGSACGDDGVHEVRIWGADKRALLYGAGELLRRLEYGAESVAARSFEVSTAPAYRFRNAGASQGHTMREITGARAWTSDERQDYQTEQVLAGSTSGFADFDPITSIGCRPNRWWLDEDYPDEWQATEMGPWVCPSIPEAREAVIEYWKDDLRQRQRDVLRFFSGDPGGCRCDDCAPWGRTFLYMAKEIAKHWLEEHPDGTVLLVTQDLDNEGDAYIFNYISEESPDWLDGIMYGPGGNAMSPYFREELRKDLFKYPRHGPINRYLAEILNELPGDMDIVHFSDITHWISAQYEVDNPEPHIFDVFGRRTFHARPKAFYEIFQQIMPFSEGDIIYTEGYHDEFNQFLWQRLLWDPHQSLDDVLMDYCTYHFGADAAPLMAEALRLLEKNLERPLADNDGVNEYYTLVREAGWAMPERYMEHDHRWHLHMQKAALDKYVQLKLLREKDQTERVYAQLEEGLAHEEEAAAIEAAQEALDEPDECREMRRLRAEAGELGEITEERFGVRNIGYFNLDRPLTEAPWLARELAEAADAEEDERRELIEWIVYYDETEPGEFYDDAGNPDRQPRLVRGSSFNARQFMDPANRPSQNTIAYTLMEPDGVAFHYTDLDPDASYRVRMTMAAPQLPQTMAAGAPELVLAQHVLANGEYLARELEIPEYTAERFEFDIPPEATRDRELTIEFEPVEGGIATVVSEMWLLKD